MTPDDVRQIIGQHADDELERHLQLQAEQGGRPTIAETAPLLYAGIRDEVNRQLNAGHVLADAANGKHLTEAQAVQIREPHCPRCAATRRARGGTELRVNTDHRICPMLYPVKPWCRPCAVCDRFDHRRRSRFA